MRPYAWRLAGQKAKTWLKDHHGDIINVVFFGGCVAAVITVIVLFCSAVADGADRRAAEAKITAMKLAGGTEAPTKKEGIPEKKEPEFTVDMALDAVVRTISADKVCYDEEHNAYYMHWTDVHTKDIKRNGWYMMKDVPFLHSANGTWFVVDVNSVPDVEVGVDVTDLPCKEGKGK